MADVDPKIAQKVFQDYTKGLRVSDISERHGIPNQTVRKIVKFESVVHTRVQEQLARLEKKTKKQESKALGNPQATVSAQSGKPKAGKGKK